MHWKKTKTMVIFNYFSPTLTDVQQFCFLFVISKLYFNKWQRKRNNTTKSGSTYISISNWKTHSRPLVSPADQGSQGTLEGGLQGSLAKQGINYFRPSINHIMTGCWVILVMGEAKVIKLGSPGGKEQREEQRRSAAVDIYHTEAVFTTQFQRLPKTVGFASTANVTPWVCLG